MSSITVIVCAKNEERFLEECLLLLSRQKVKPEIIVIDGHSKDRTVKIAKKYADRVVYDNRSGIGKARDMAVDAAKGDIIAFCDADSRPPLDWTEKIIKNIEGYDAISGPLSCYDGSYWMKKNLRLWGNLFPRIAALFNYKSIWGANMAFRREILKKYKFEVRFLEDYRIGRLLGEAEKKINFTKDIFMPISSRMFVKGFYKTCLKFYLMPVLEMKLGGEKDLEWYLNERFPPWNKV